MGERGREKEGEKDRVRFGVKVIEGERLGEKESEREGGRIIQAE